MSDRNMSAMPTALRGLLHGLIDEERRLEDAIPLTANENKMSALACGIQGTSLSHRYLLGVEGERSEQGLDFVKAGLMLDGLPAATALERRAACAARSLFGVESVEFRPLSGLHATLCTLLSLSRPGAVVLSISPLNNGHFATSGLVTAIGRRSMHFAWNEAACTIDSEKAARQIEALPDGSLIFLDHSAPLFPQPVKALRAAVHSDIRIVYDASHTLGLIAGGQFQDPVGEGADVLQGNTHKTFPGPHKGIILSARRSVGRLVEETMSDNVVSTQHTHHSLALHVTMLEMESHAKNYARQVVGNARALAEALSESGFAVRRRADGQASASHMVLVGGFQDGEAYRFCARMRACGFLVNARSDSQGELIRFGVQELTRRGLTESDIPALANLLRRTCQTEEASARIAANAKEFLSKFTTVGYSFTEARDCHASSCGQVNRAICPALLDRHTAMPIRSPTIGFSTNVLHHPTNTAIAVAEVAAAVAFLCERFHAVEIELSEQVQPAVLQCDRASYGQVVASIRDTARRTGAMLSVHAPWFGEATNLAAKCAEERRQSIELLARAVQFAADIGSDLVTCHPGYHEGQAAEDFGRHLHESLGEVVRAAAAKGVQVCLENMGDDRPSCIVLSVEEQIELCRATGAKVTLDVIHLRSRYGNEADFLDALARIAPQVANVHIADMKGRNHAHLPIGDGDLPLGEVLRRLGEAGYAGAAIVEEFVRTCDFQRFLDKAIEFRGRYDGRKREVTDGAPTVAAAGPQKKGEVRAVALGKAKGAATIVVTGPAGSKTFVNSCPHNGALLDALSPLSTESGYLVCSVHGALFDDSGLCVRGPCNGRSLKPSSAEATDESRLGTPTSF